MSRPSQPAAAPSDASVNAPAAPSARPGATASRTADPSRGQNSSRSAPATKGTVTSLPLPPAGPQWYGSLMGTGIAATLTQTLGGDLPGARGLAVALLVASISSSAPRPRAIQWAYHASFCWLLRPISWVR